MARSGDGWCPFARQIEGIQGYGRELTPKVGWCDHTAGGFFGTLIDPNFWNKRGTSVQFAVSRDGEIAQLINLFNTCYGQGQDANENPVGPSSPGVTWPPFADMGFGNPNVYLVAIEHEDYTLVNGVSTPVPGSEWTPAQYDADLRLKRWCEDEQKRVYGLSMLKYDIDSLAGHYMFDPVNRAECPGRFWRDQYRQSLYNSLASEGDMFVRHNARSLWFDDPTHRSFVDTTVHCNAALDFNLPADAMEVQVEIECAGGDLLILDGLNDVDLDGYAGKRNADGAYSTQQFRVKLEKTNTGAWFSMRADGAIHLTTVGCVGYFT